MKRKPMPGHRKKHSPSDHPAIESLRKRIAQAPTEPGVYKWLDEKGEVLYVGKAKNLRNRLRSYVANKTDTFAGPWKLSFLQQIADFQVTVVNNEVEALVLETNLIKELKPKYNVMMKDDKNYLFIRVSDESYPRVETVRRLGRDHAQYFGPYLSSYEVHRILDMLHEAVQYRACTHSLDVLNGKGAAMKPCLDSQIGLCCGLCGGVIDKDTYRARITEVIAFLRGRQDTVRVQLQERMQEAVRGQKFERAAKLRDLLKTLDGETAQQIASDPNGDDADIVGVAILSGRASVVLFHQRGGRLLGEIHFSLRGQAESAASVLEQFLPQYYEEGREIPPVIILSEDFEDRAVLEQLLRERRGGAVRILVPERGKKSRLLQLAEKNAQEKARQEEVKWEAEKRNIEEALTGLQMALGLKEPPRRIEGYDISHLGGTETVGSMVVIKDGKAANDQYRNFTIRSMREGVVDDYKALREVLRRRLRHVSGGLQTEVETWKQNGVEIRKARKADRPSIETLIKENPRDLSSDDLDQGEFTVAIRESEVVGCCRIFLHPTGLRELRSVCVAESERGDRLGHVVVRLCLSREKKEKTYIVIDPQLEQYYASVGFRHVLKCPPVLAKKVEGILQDDPSLAPPIVMVYDPVQNKTDSSLSDAPDLLVIDGGKGQLGAALEVLKEAQLTIPAVGLAKREEDIFVPGQSEPIVLAKDSPAQFMLMRLRDEAHRFANRHRERRGSVTAKRSILDTIPSIGPETKKILLSRYKTIDGIKNAPADELRELLNDDQYHALRSTL